MAKKPKTIWIILIVIALIVAALSINSCINARTSVDASVFDKLVTIQSTNTEKDIKKADILADNTLKVISNEIPFNYEKVKITNVVFDDYVVDFVVTVYGTSYNSTIECTTTFVRRCS